MNIDSERYKVSVEFSVKPKIPIEKVKKIFGLDNLTEPGYLKPESNRRGVYFKICEEVLWATVAEDRPSWVKAYNVVYDSIPDLIKKVEKLSTQNLMITIYDTETSTVKLVLERSSNSYWEICNGYRSAIIGRRVTELQKSEIVGMLKDYISEV